MGNIGFHMLQGFIDSGYRKFVIADAKQRKAKKVKNKILQLHRKLVETTGL